MLYPDFESLGLTEAEGKVYITLLELGGGYVSTIARKAKLPRVNCYYTIEKLIKKGLVAGIKKESAYYYMPEPPQKLVNSLEDRFEYGRKILPELLSIANTSTFKPKIRYFEGLEGLKSILDDTLTAKTELLGYSNLKAASDIFKDYLNQYAYKKRERRLKTRIICPSSPEAFKYPKKYYPKDFPADLLEILFVNPKEFWFEHEITIYDDKVAVISLDREELIGMIFESPVYARSQKAIFNLAWLGASSFIAL
ncbi:MAG: hypothetical protein NTZ80_00300 [Patescibacteria group bacterium]|nr:hypothetical protein [Patescibacteria group bacterium]